MLSVVVPVYGNADTIPELVDRLKHMSAEVEGGLEAVFVIDGSPDESGTLLRAILERGGLQARLIWHARNFGSIAAVRTGMAHASGDYVAVMSADLQEPESLVVEFHQALRTGDFDIAVGTRRSRQDGRFGMAASNMFWRIYRRLVQKEMPVGGADAFACTRQVAEVVAHMSEANTSLIGLLFWVGYRRVLIPFDRLPRLSGKSGWTLRRKVRYLFDSVFSFTDLPINLLLFVGVAGIGFSLLLSVAILISWSLGQIDVPGYTPLMLAILTMSSLILFGLGVVGSYIWRAYENTKDRPFALTRREERFGDS